MHCFPCDPLLSKESMQLLKDFLDYFEISEAASCVSNAKCEPHIISDILITIYKYNMLQNF
jgi:hypothetical protein